jgi:isopentenyl diphosphate isomerase/L-lactate dehydrogenase-like FMN-dependent dehydrogenase
MDGGIRSGQHVLKAVALGAKGTYIGRAMLYGLGAMGEEGVDALKALADHPQRTGPVDGVLRAALIVRCP